MDTSVLLRQLLRVPNTYRTLLTSPPRPQIRTFALLSPQLAHPRHLTVPRILQPSFWTSMVPRPLRERAADPNRGEWNPATPYIVLALLVGSQAIQILWLKQESDKERRRAEASISVLRGVVDRVQGGEVVDVEGALGTGVEGARGGTKEIEGEELLYQSDRERKRSAPAESMDVGVEQRERGSEGEKLKKLEEQEDAKFKVESLGGAKFY
ncbi:hypothetical protein N0V90_008559 [Kalmusia sp. IMI 367209]|nr:hypothetical protein N0V90_008559 [Kalmusia sp. IMI 367209]